MSAECSGLTGRIFGHRILIQLDREPVTPVDQLLVSVSETETEGYTLDILRANRKETYVCHYCSRCGERWGRERAA